MKTLQITERRLASFDGTDLAYHVVGEGLPVLLCNGLGGSWVAWSHTIDFFKDRYRFISWDYRGMYRSGAPRDPAALRVVDHARDGLAVLAAEGVERAAFFGWSMGVQVALEMFRAAPDRVAALTFLNGVAGAPFDSVLGFGVMGHVLPAVVRGIGAVPRVAEAVVSRLAGLPETVQWAKRLGVASHTLDEDIFHQLAASFRELDMATYMRILEYLGEHDGWDVLDEIDVPTLVIAGGRDPLTPRAVAQRMAARIRGAELLIVPGATHYAAVEYPELINLRIDKFFRERGYAPEPR
ncbi:MAG: alpha/beta hydrolase [Myxococcales bacterium]|nr:alpha/beta hydrolase [Myxococcales bacterium]